MYTLKNRVVTNGIMSNRNVLMKFELLILFSVMKSIEFSGLEEREVNKTKSLEMLLLEKNKTLQNENTQLKVTNSEISGKFTAFSCNIVFILSPWLPVRRTVRMKQVSELSSTTSTFFSIAFLIISTLRNQVPNVSPKIINVSAAATPNVIRTCG